MTRKKLRHIEKRKLQKECWDLDGAFLDWLRKRLPIYLHDASSIVNLDYHKFTYNKEEYTQKELIELLISLLNEISTLDTWDKEYENKVNSVLDIWKLIFHTMWW